MSRSVATTLIARAIQIVAGFGGTVATARFLGPDARGEYFFVVTLTLVVVQFANLGLHSSNTYYVARNPRLLGPLVANSIWTSVVLGAGSAVAAVAILRVTDWFPTQRPSLLWFSVALAPAILFFMLGTNLLVGANRIGTFNVFEMVGNLLVVVALVAAGVASLKVRGFLAVSACAWTLASGALALYLTRASHARLGFRRDVFKDGLLYATKAYLIAALSYFVLRGNVFLLQRFYGARELGYYSVAAQVADVLAIFPTSVALVLFPRLVRGGTGSWHVALRTCVVVGVVLAVVCAAAAALATPFMRIAFGEAFVPAGQVLRLLLPGVFALGLTTVLSQYLAAIGVPRLNVVVWAVALVAVLSLGRLLVPSHAGAGAAAALSITYWLVLAMVLALGLRHRRHAPSALEPAAVDRLQPLEVPEPHGGTA